MGVRAVIDHWLGRDRLRESEARIAALVEDSFQQRQQGWALAQTIDHLRTKLPDSMTPAPWMDGRARIGIAPRAQENPNVIEVKLAESSTGYSASTWRRRQAQSSTGPWEQLSSDAGGGARSEDVIRAREGWYDEFYDRTGLLRRFPTSKQVTNLHADFCFGGGVESPSAKDDTVTEMLDDWWWNSTNQCAAFSFEAQRALSARLLVEGELFFAVFAAGDKKPMRVRIIDPLEITQPVVHPDDSSKVIYWERRHRPLIFDPASGSYQKGQINGEQEVRSYYPVLGLADDEEYDDPYAGAEGEEDFQQRIEVDTGGNPVQLLHVALGAMRETDRGVGIFGCMMDLELALMELIEDQLTISRSTAALMNTLRTEGGEANVAAAMAHWGQTGDNPTTQPPNAGDMNIMSTGAELKTERASTQAGDATMNVRLILRQLGQCGGVSLHYIGDPENAGLATAHEMEGPQLKHFEAYQGKWTNIYLQLSHAVLRSRQLDPMEYNITVPMPSLVTEVLADLVNAIVVAHGQGYLTDRQATVAAHKALKSPDPTADAEEAIEEQEAAAEEEAADAEQAALEFEQQQALMAAGQVRPDGTEMQALEPGGQFVAAEEKE